MSRSLRQDAPTGPMLTVDVVVLAPGGGAGAGAGPGAGARAGAPCILLVRRANPPFAGHWALPGGFVERDERVRDAAPRELREETGLSLEQMDLLGVYDTPGRDPRGWTVSVVYLARVRSAERVCGGDDAADARWFAADALPAMAFDHDLIVADALRAA